MDALVHSPMNEAGEGHPLACSNHFVSVEGRAMSLERSVSSKPWLVAALLQGMHVGRAPP